MRGPIARSTIRTSAVLAARVVLQAGTLLLVARLLGPHDYGTFVGIAALATLLGTLSTFGTHLVLLGKVSRAPTRRATAPPFIISTTLIFGSALLGIYLLLGQTLLHDTAVNGGVLLSIGIAEVLFLPLLNVPAAELQGRGNVATSQLLMTLPLLLRLLVAACVWLLQPQFPLSIYAYGYMATSFASLLAATICLRGVWPELRDWRLPTIAELRHSAGYAALNLSAAGPAEFDKTLALNVLPPAAAGVYSAGARVMGALTLPVLAMMLSAIPRLFRDGNSQHFAASNSVLKWVFGASLAYSMLLTGALWLIAPVFDWLFGPSYRGLTDTIRLLCLAVPGMALRIAAGGALMALDRPWARVHFEISGLVVLGAMTFALTPRLGNNGMPLALVCAESAMAIYGWHSIFHYRPKAVT